MVGYRGFILHKDGKFNVGVKWNCKGEKVAVIKNEDLKKLMLEIDMYLFKRDYGQDYDKFISDNKEK